MIRPRMRLTWLSLLAILGMGAAPTRSESPQVRMESAARVPLAELPPGLRERVKKVLDQPALFARGPTEEFEGKPTLYLWFLDHPNRAAQAWQRLGAPCVEIVDRGHGRFAWSDGEGTDISWETAYRSGVLRVWYAEGRARPTPYLPSLPVRAVVVLRHGQRQDDLGRNLLCQQADVFLQTDNRTASFLTRLLGPSVPHLAEEGVAQLEMFFSLLVGYLERYPDRAERLLGGQPIADPAIEYAAMEP